MSSAATRAPARAKQRAIARPMPDPAPVTSAVLPSRCSCGVVTESAIDKCSQSVHPRGILGIEGVPFVIVPCVGEVSGKVEALGVVASKRQHRPIASVEDTIDAEAVHGVHGVGKQVLLTPVCRMGFREKTGDLAADVLVFGEASQLSAPGLEGALSDRRLAAVIENELCVRALLDESDRLAQLIVGDTEVEGPAASSDFAHAVDVRRPQGESGRLSLNVLANAPYSRVTR